VKKIVTLFYPCSRKLYRRTYYRVNKRLQKIIKIRTLALSFVFVLTFILSVPRRIKNTKLYTAPQSVSKISSIHKIHQV